ncbi:MAG: Asp-tRNA(Asn)/Glu-tRNA(Gln) amidotransferase subunit GatA [bacterium]|nr:Asp-tRNA(Asn)/Glu-tRNA(Gln) amidotransferase subunit GatA [bacterium]
MLDLQASLHLIQSRKKKLESLVSDTISDIRSRDDFNIFLDVYEDKCLAKAAEIDRKISDGKAGKLAGAIIAIKDNICINGQKLTCASKTLENYISPYSATVINKLEDADAVVIGKTNLDEFAMGSSSEYSYFGPVRNPVAPDYVPGGSSGGSAAAVAGKFVPAALGSDTGGSIRQPAAFCGICGLKPSYGRVSRYGLTAFASSLEQIGPLAQNTDDIARILEIISGYDTADSTSVNESVPDFSGEINKDPGNLRIGIPADFFGNGLDSEIRTAINTVIEKLSSDNFRIKEIRLPKVSYSAAVYYIIANAEASSNLARYDGVRYGCRSSDPAELKKMYFETRSDSFGDEVKRRIILGTYVLSAGYYDEYYSKAQKVRKLIVNDFDDVFREIDLIITPVTPTPPFRIGEKTDNPLDMYLNDIYTIPVNLAGLPALVLPCGSTSEGLPVGLQIIGRHFDEISVLKLGKLLEQYN